MIYDEVAMHTAKSQMHSFATRTHTVNPVVQTQENSIEGKHWCIRNTNNFKTKRTKNPETKTES